MAKINLPDRPTLPTAFFAPSLNLNLSRYCQTGKRMGSLKAGNTKSRLQKSGLHTCMLIEIKFYTSIFTVWKLNILLLTQSENRNAGIPGADPGFFFDEERGVCVYSTTVGKNPLAAICMLIWPGYFFFSTTRQGKKNIM